jgi:hypothetical protein
MSLAKEEKMDEPMTYIGGSDNLQENIDAVTAIFHAEDPPIRVEVRDSGGNIVFFLEK